MNVGFEIARDADLRMVAPRDFFTVGGEQVQTKVSELKAVVTTGYGEACRQHSISETARNIN